MKKLIVTLFFIFLTSNVFGQVAGYFVPLVIENDTVGYKDTSGGDFVVIKVWGDESEEIFNRVVNDNKRLKVQRASSAEKIQIEFLWSKNQSSREPLKKGAARHLINAGNSMRAGLLVNIIGTAGGTVLVYTGQPVLGSLVITASGLVSTIMQFYTAAELTNAGLEFNE